MVTIKEAELLTGITRQNIRYYEKMGLIHPSREKENQYRKYNKDDIRRLKLIYMFRKLDMPLEEIQQILDGRKDLQEALEQQKEQLRQKQQKLAAALFLLWGNTGNRTYRSECGSLSAENGSRRKTGK